MQQHRQLLSILRCYRLCLQLGGEFSVFSGFSFSQIATEYLHKIMHISEWGEFNSNIYKAKSQDGMNRDCCEIEVLSFNLIASVLLAGQTQTTNSRHSDQ